MKQTQTTTDYQQQATDFLEATQTTFKATFLKNGKHFADDKESRDIYEIELKRGNRSYKFNFGQSLSKSTKLVDKLNGNEFTMNGSSLKGNRRIVDMKFATDYCKRVKGTPPTSYNILACLTKYEPGTFEDFCGEFGYDTDSKKAEKTYNAVKDEWLNVSRLFTDAEIELLQEIQ